MKIQKSDIRALCNATCAKFTIFTFVYTLIELAMDSSLLLRVSSFVWLLPFCLTLSVANAVYCRAGLRLSARIAIHALCCEIGFLLFVYLPNSGSGNGISSALVMMLVFSVLYAIIFSVWAGIRHRLKKALAPPPTDSYQQVFKKK